MDITVTKSDVKDTKDEEPLDTVIFLSRRRDILNYSSAVKSSSKTWTQRMSVRAWEMWRISTGRKFMIP